MSMFVNFEGSWRRADPPLVRDAGEWHQVESVYAHTQGAWRRIWPAKIIEPVQITVSAEGGTWPAVGRVVVTIEHFPQAKEHGAPGQTAAPSKGVVTVVSGEWSDSFDATLGRAVFDMPLRDAGDYSVDAVWSSDPDVFGTDQYRIRKATADAVLMPEQTVRLGQQAHLTTRIVFQGSDAPEGGMTSIRRQEDTNGAMEGWIDARIYTGVPTQRVVAPSSTMVWQTMLHDHPNIEDAVSGTCLVKVLTPIGGYSDVVPTAVRSYMHGGDSIRQYSYNLYHGTEFDDGESSTYGSQFGVVWLPPLPEHRECTGVAMRWYPEFTGVETEEPGERLDARMAVGAHILPSPPSSIVPGSDSRIKDSLIGARMNREEPLWIDLSSILTEVVNTHRSGGFGVIVGSSLLPFPEWYGYGRPITFRYTWEEWH